MAVMLTICFRLSHEDMFQKGSVLKWKIQKVKQKRRHDNANNRATRNKTKTRYLYRFCLEIRIVRWALIYCALIFVISYVCSHVLALINRQAMTPAA